ncbi:MAG: DUF4381 domain-containing protein [Geminicoccaceae bacterium]
MSDDLSTMNLVELLDLLEPVPEPPAVPLWPETVGWIWLGIVLIAGLAWLVRRWLLDHRANAYRRAALKEVALAGDDASAVAEVLRRTAIAAFPRAKTAGLYGEDWLAFLDRTYGGTGFSKGPGRVIASAPYRSVNDNEDLAPLATAWVRRHRQGSLDDR